MKLNYWEIIFRALFEEHLTGSLPSLLNISMDDEFDEGNDFEGHQKDLDLSRNILSIRKSKKL